MATKPKVDPNLAAAVAQVQAALNPAIQQTQTDARNKAIGTLAAYNAAAAAQEPLAGQVGSAFQGAADRTAVYAKGYSDQMRQLTGSNADQANKLLAQNGSPQHIDAPSGQSDVLYNLGGASPAGVLATSGAAFQSAAAAAPGTTRGVGLQGYQGALNEGAANVAKLEATRPGLVQSALSALTSEAERRREFGMSYGLDQKRLAQDQTQSDREFQLAVAKFGEDKRQFGLSYALDQAKAAQPNYHFFQGANGGEWLFDNTTGGLHQLTPGQKKARFTPAETSAFKADASEMARKTFWGVTDPKTKKLVADPLGYQAAMTELLQHGIPLAVAQNALNRYWKKPGYEADVESRKKAAGNLGGVTWDRATKGGGRPVQPFQERNPGKTGATASPAAARTPDGAKQTAFQIASKDYGWTGDELAALEQLWNNESGWNYQARNGSSGAAGIPQALGHSLPADYASNPVTQIKWGLNYIKQRYGSPSKALAFWLSDKPAGMPPGHWY